MKEKYNRKGVISGDMLKTQGRKFNINILLINQKKLDIDFFLF